MAVVHFWLLNCKEPIIKTYQLTFVIINQWNVKFNRQHLMNGGLRMDTYTLALGYFQIIIARTIAQRTEK